MKQQIIDLSGQTHIGNVESVVVERHSAVEVTFLIHGSYSHAARYYQRVTLFRDVPVVFFDHTWEYMGDMHKDKFREISVELLLPESPRSPALAPGCGSRSPSARPRGRRCRSRR